MFSRKLIVFGTLLLLSATAHAQVLLIPDSGTDRIWSFSPIDGSLINNAFITNDGHFQLPFNAIDSGRGTIFISDQNADAVFEYGYNGSFIQTIVDSTDGIDNIRGIAVNGNKLFVTLGAGAFNNTIQSFDLNGGSQSTFISTNLSSPFDIYFRQNDVLVSNSSSNLIQRFDFNGVFLGTWHSGAIRFPEQMQERANLNVLAAGFSTPSGVYEYNAAGVQQGVFATGLGQRGVYPLANGNYLFTGGTRVAVVNPTNGVVTDVVNLAGSAFRYIELVPVPEPTTLALFGLSALAIRRKR